MSWQRCCVCLLGLLALIAEARSDQPAAKSGPLVVRRVEIPGPKTLDRRENRIDVGALVRGVPTELRIALPADELPAPDSIVLAKTCSCFSAKLIAPGSSEGTGQQEIGWTGLSIITIPTGQFLRETIYVYPKVDDLGKDADKRDPREALFAFEITGAVFPLVEVKFSSDRVPWGDEKLTVTVRAKNGDFRVDSSSIELEAPDLRMEESKLKPNGDVEIALSRLQRQGDIPEEDSEERRLFAIRVRCKVVSTQDAQVSLHYDDTYRLWGGDSIRMIPTQVLIERDQSESVLWLTIVDMLGDSEAEEDFPYLLSFVKRDGGEEEIALLPENIQRVSRSRWKVGLLPPKVDPEVKVVSVRLRKKGLLKNSRSLASTNLLFMQ